MNVIYDYTYFLRWWHDLRYPQIKKKTNIFYHGFKNENASKLLRAPLKKNFNKNYKIRVSSSVVIQDLQEGNQEHPVQFNLCQVLNLFKK